ERQNFRHLFGRGRKYRGCGAAVIVCRPGELVAGQLGAGHHALRADDVRQLVEDRVAHACRPTIFTMRSRISCTSHPAIKVPSDPIRAYHAQCTDVPSAAEESIATPITNPASADRWPTRGANTPSKYKPSTGPVANPLIFRTFATVLSPVPSHPYSTASPVCRRPNRIVASRLARTWAAWSTISPRSGR